jgi:hypothetical protein
MLLGAGAALTSAALIGPATAGADDHTAQLFDPPPLAPPAPIPGGFAPTLHAYAPGPTGTTLPFSGAQLMGLDVEPAAITDFSGFTALVYPVGTARGSDGKHYNLEGDMRVYSGTYQPFGGGSKRQGTFGFV